MGWGPSARRRRMRRPCSSEVQRPCAWCINRATRRRVPTTATVREKCAGDLMMSSGPVSLTPGTDPSRRTRGSPPGSARSAPRWKGPRARTRTTSASRDGTRRTTPNSRTSPSSCEPAGSTSPSSGTSAAHARTSYRKKCSSWWRPSGSRWWRPGRRARAAGTKEKTRRRKARRMTRITMTRITTRPCRCEPCETR